eukprot:2772884-Prymnesium_polylepis.1
MIGVEDDGLSRWRLRVATLCPAKPPVCAHATRAGLSTLFITAGDGVWSVTTNVQGVAPPTDSFRRKMDKYVAAGDFRHAGW